MSSVWGIPFGHIERSFDPNKKYEMPVADHESMTTAEYDFRAICPVGDFPADHWAVHAIDENSGVCLFNKGTPCVKWLPGCFELSLLRSPQMEGSRSYPTLKNSGMLRESQILENIILNLLCIHIQNMWAMRVGSVWICI